MRATLEVVEKGKGTNAPKRLVCSSLLPLGGSFVLKLLQLTGEITVVIFSFNKMYGRSWRQLFSSFDRNP